MANVKPEQVFVVGLNGTASLSQITAALSNGTDLTTAFNLPAAVGSLYAFTETNVAVPDVTNAANGIPERIQFAIGDSVRTLRLSDYIRKGQVEKYSRTQAKSKTPLVWTINFADIFTDFSADPGNSVTLMIQYRKTSMDFCMQKIQVTLRYLGSGSTAQDHVSEMARLINEAVTEQLMQGQWKPISAYGDNSALVAAETMTADTLFIHETQMPADFSGINTPNQFIFDVTLSSSYNNSTGFQDDYWTQFGAIPTTLSRQFYNAPNVGTGDILVYRRTNTVTFGNGSGYWHLASVAAKTPVVAFETTANINLTGNGLPILIKSHLREADWGYNGVQNRTHYADPGYDEVVNNNTQYDTHIIDYYESSMVEMGGSTSRRKAKRLIIYFPVFNTVPGSATITTVTGNTSANLETFINRLIGIPTATMHI